MSTNNNLINLVKQILTRLKEFPKVLRYLAIAVISVLVAIILLGIVGCGSVTRITVKSENPNETTISVNQSNDDSTNTSVQINPTINFPQSYGKKDETQTE